MKQEIFEITENIMIAPDVYKMHLTGDTSQIKCPGQFVNIKLDGFFLRRPISLCDYDESGILLIYKTVGAGTLAMAQMGPGEQLDLLTGLGNGYDTSVSGEAPLLIGGGTGVPPMYKLAKVLLSEGKNVSVVLGFNKKEEIFFEDEFRELGCNVRIATADGSYGIKGFVTDALPDEYSYFYTCGPMPMFKAVYAVTVTSGQFSYEERMGCGFGACMGCSVKTKDGFKRVCKDGPVLRKEEILWN